MGYTLKLSGTNLRTLPNQGFFDTIQNTYTTDYCVNEPPEIQECQEVVSVKTSFASAAGPPVIET